MGSVMDTAIFKLLEEFRQARTSAQETSFKIAGMEEELRRLVTQGFSSGDGVSDYLIASGRAALLVNGEDKHFRSVLGVLSKAKVLLWRGKGRERWRYGGPLSSSASDHRDSEEGEWLMVLAASTPGFSREPLALWFYLASLVQLQAPSPQNFTFQEAAKVFLAGLKQNELLLGGRLFGGVTWPEGTSSQTWLSFAVMDSRLEVTTDLQEIISRLLYLSCAGRGSELARAILLLEDLGISHKGLSDYLVQRRRELPGEYPGARDKRAADLYDEAQVLGVSLGP